MGFRLFSFRGCERFWNFLSRGFLMMFFVLSSILVDLNKTFIVLVLKVQAPKSVTQFGPISLCSILYKMLTKKIINRLKGILSKVVVPTQCSFVLG